MATGIAHNITALENESKRKLKPGTKIPIKINGKKIITVIDDGGVQRLPNNKVLAYLVRGQAGSGTFGMNKLWSFHDSGMFSEEDVRFVYQNIGYSVCGYSEIFGKDKIENPLWRKK